jgi:hypothetical protein
MLWYTIQSKQNTKSPRTSSTLGLKNHFRATTFDRHLEINLYLHSGLRFRYWRDSRGELFRICRFHPRSLLRTASKRWIEAEYKEKTDIQKVIFKKRVDFDGEKLGTADLSLIYQIKQASQPDLSHLVAPRGVLSSLTLPHGGSRVHPEPGFFTSQAVGF